MSESAKQQQDWAWKIIALGGLGLSAAGVVAISSHEGLRYAAYPDPATHAAPWTICYGHTGPEVKPGLVATQSQCDKWLAEDLRKAEQQVRSVVKVRITQGELDAYTSFVYNAGIGNFRSSTMLKLINQGKRKEACDQFPRWSYANKIKLEGLAKRRYEERAMCLKGGKYVNAAIMATR
ncbi:endolysin [Xanthomonas phage Xop411]|uniref:Endolysin n=2 Tax=Caudoviricetes TaxID=2731619 RepID=A5H1N1_9CAUD|nr:endolysin [Xanthomonas phage Xop411]ABD72265.1 lysozyme [Xanthomonas phage Xo411]ABK00175.1 p28 [Xanthomonas phage Xop411]